VQTVRRGRKRRERTTFPSSSTRSHRAHRFQKVKQEGRVGHALSLERRNPEGKKKASWPFLSLVAHIGTGGGGKDVGGVPVPPSTSQSPEKEKGPAHLLGLLRIVPSGSTGERKRSAKARRLTWHTAEQRKEAPEAELSSFDEKKGAVIWPGDHGKRKSHHRNQPSKGGEGETRSCPITLFQPASSKRRKESRRYFYTSEVLEEEGGGKLEAVTVEEKKKERSTTSTTTTFPFGGEEGGREKGK